MKQKAQREMTKRLTPIGDGIWVVEGGPVRFLGLSLPTRMTVVRLEDGSLWMHSPVFLDEDLACELDGLGPIGHLVAPNKYHHLFLADWVRRYPLAAVHAAPGLRNKRPDISFSEELGAAPHPAWTGQINQVVFSGSTSFDEVIFFHENSATAILTDLIVNVRLEGQSALGRIVACLDGVSYPNGGVPNLYKVSVCRRAPAEAAIQRLLAWAPQQAVISHGEWFETDATNQLASRFAWLLRP